MQLWCDLTLVQGQKRAFGIVVLGVLAATSPGAIAQDWPGHARDAQHTALSRVPSQVPETIRWSMPVDLDPQYSGGELLTHYGSPMITELNTVLVPVKTGETSGFRIVAVRGHSGEKIWSMDSDYTLPPFNWIPPWGPTLRPGGFSVVMPAAGGTVMVRRFPDLAQGETVRQTFFGINNYNADPGSFNSAIQICTPITSDDLGNLYFGYLSSGAALPGFPAGIPGGLARISWDGHGKFVPAAKLANNPAYTQVVTNCAPALKGGTVYVAVSTGYYGNGYLCSADAETLAPANRVFLVDPLSGQGASVFGDGTSTPTIGPDGDVYYGVLESSPGSNNFRGWLLHYNAALAAPAKIPGAFGWDITPSIVPAKAVPSYTGTSSYLIMSKYNNYANGGGNGLNKVAILDPNATETDPITGVTVMNEVISILGPTKNPNLPGVNEWCINSAAVDPFTKSAVVNSEDGHVYRWDFTTNTLSTGLKLAPPTGEAYTPSLIGIDGAVYAINNGVLFCCVHSHR